MSADIEFVPGLIVKAPRNGAPEYVKCSLSMKRAELIAFLMVQSGDWLNVEVKEAKSGKWYAAVDNWKPNQAREENPRKAAAPPIDFDADEIFPY